ncbi:Mbeg1-like protein [Mesobacillus jeotgali]|uniref:Mbeg1-like protein n=1 Tax=Mesobacillus jeotgali TaxID=129985 RepID=UPI00131548F3|nr:Mbeg1-like protein [Mesobacillus jeotgali]
MSLDQLTDEEKNVLLMLSYYDLPNNQPLNGKSIERIWDYAKMSADKNEESYKQLEAFFLSDSFKSSNLHNIKLSGYQNHNPNEGNNTKGASDSGFVGYAFEDNSGNSTAVFRGSEAMGDMGHLRTDWTSNFEASMGVEITQQKEANAFYQKYLSDTSGERLLLGHSKGGNLADYVFINNLDDNTKAYVINAAPLYWWSLSKKEQEALMGDRHDFIVYAFDPVSQLGKVPYVDKTIGLNEDYDLKKPFYPHSLTSSAGFDENGNYRVYENGQSFGRYVLNNMVFEDIFYGLSTSTPIKAYKAAYVVANAAKYVMHYTAKAMTAAAHLIREQTVKLIVGLAKAKRELEEKVNSFFTDLIAKASVKIGSFIDSLNGNNFPIEPYIKVDIPRLFYYANRLRSVQRRVAQLNDMIDDLYWEAGVMGLDNVLAADIASSFDIRIPESINYLNRTAELLQQNERYLAGKAGSIRG